MAPAASDGSSNVLSVVRFIPIRNFRSEGCKNRLCQHKLGAFVHHRNMIHRRGREMHASQHCDPKIPSTIAGAPSKPSWEGSALLAYRWQVKQARFHGLIGWIRHWLQSDQRAKLRYNANLWRGACQTAERLDYQIEEICWEEGISARRFKQILIARGIQGVLVAPHSRRFVSACPCRNPSQTLSQRTAALLGSSQRVIRVSYDFSKQRFSARKLIPVNPKTVGDYLLLMRIQANLSQQPNCSA